jgi:hypothetical protein
VSTATESADSKNGAFRILYSCCGANSGILLLSGSFENTSAVVGNSKYISGSIDFWILSEISPIDSVRTDPKRDPITRPDERICTNSRLTKVFEAGPYHDRMHEHNVCKTMPMTDSGAPEAPPAGCQHGVTHEGREWRRCGMQGCAGS